MTDTTSTVSIPTDQPEAWRPVVGHERLYSVSDLGRVRRDAPTRGRGICGMIFVPFVSRSGYLRIHVQLNGRSRHISIHHWVAAAFIGPRPAGMEVNHRDGNKFNNRANNLEYATPHQNNLHACRTGLRSFDSTRGERNVNAKLNPEKVRQMRALRAAGASWAKIAASQSDVSLNSARAAVLGHTWKHVPA